MASSKIKGITIEIGGNTTKLGKALDGVDKQSKSLQKELKGVNSLLKLDPKNVELLKQKQDLLTQSITETEQKQKLLQETLKQIDSGKVEVTKEQYRDLQREIVYTDQKLEELNDEMKNFGSVATQQLKVVGNELKETGTKIEETGQKLAGVSATATAGLIASGKLAVDNEAAINRYMTATGEAVEETEKYKSIMQELYSANYGDSIEDVANKMALVKQNLGDISDEQLKEVTESAYLLQDAFGIDFSEAVRGINGLMTNMGLTSKEAFDLMVVGSQNGLNKSNELGDNIAEYSQLWGQAGFSAEEMFAILQNGLDSGAYNLDKVNDFVKEFTISLSDGRIEDNIGSFSVKTQDLFKNWQDGKATSKDVFNSVISDLEGMTNKQDALTLASTVWSALGEDNAMTVITSLNDVNKTYENTAGAVDKANETMYGGSGSKAQESMRQIQSAFASLGESLLPIIASISTKISELAQKFSNLSPTVQKVILVIMGIVAAITPLLIIIGKVVTAVGTIAGGIGKVIPLLAKLKPIITAIMGLAKGLFSLIMANPVVAIITAIIIAIALLWTKCEWFRDLVKGFVNVVVKLFTGIVDFFKDNWQTILLFILNPFAGVFKLLYEKCEGFRNFIDGLVESIKTIFATIVNFIKTKVIDPIVNFYIGLYNSIVAILTPIVEWFSQLFTSIANTVKSVIDVIVGLFQGSIELIKAVWGLIATWFYDNVIVPIINFFTPIIEFYRNLFQTAVDKIKEVFGIIVEWFKARWTDITNIFGVVSTWFKDKFNQAITNIKNAFTPIVSFFKDTIWGGIKKAFGNVADWFKNIFSQAWTNVKNVFSTGGKIFDGIKDGIASTFKTVVNGIIGGMNKVISVPFNAINSMLNKIRNISVAGVEPFKNVIKHNALSIPQIPKLKTGTNFVPYDNMPAILHKGEKVVPAKYNPEVDNTHMRNALMDALTDFVGDRSLKQTYIQQENSKLINLLDKYLPLIEQNLGQNIVLDDGTLVGKIIPKVDSGLGVLADKRRRGH